MHATHFTRRFLLLFSGPIIWALHFLVIYGGTGVLCARPGWRGAWPGVNLIGWGIVIAGVLAVGAIALLHWRNWRLPRLRDKTRFIEWTGAVLGLLSIIAIAWETLPVFLVAQCA